MINVEVNKTGKENTTSLVRRFTKTVQGSGVLRRVRSIRYWSRPSSKFTKRKKVLRKIERRKTFENLYKLGKIEERPRGRKGRRF